MYLINLLITATAAVAFDIPVVVYYNGVDYLIQSNEWTTDSVNVVFSAGPLLALILSITFLFVYLRVSMETGIMRLLLIWMLFHALTRFFGEMLAGALMEKGLGYVIVYSYFMDTAKLLITLLSLVAMVAAGILLARPAAYSANIYFNDLTGKRKFRVLWSQFMTPFLAGNMVIFLVKLPNVNSFDIAVNTSMLLLLGPMLIRSAGMRDLYFDEEPRKIEFRRTLALITGISLIVFRTFLGMGIRLG